MFSPNTPVIKIDDPSASLPIGNGGLASSPHQYNSLLSGSPHFQNNLMQMNNLGVNNPQWMLRGDDGGSDAGSEFDNSDAGSDHSHGSPAGMLNPNGMAFQNVHLAVPGRPKRKSSLGNQSDYDDMASDDGYLSAGSVSNYSILQMSPGQIGQIPSPLQSPNPSPELSPALHAFLFSDLLQHAPIQSPIGSPSIGLEETQFPGGFELNLNLNGGTLPGPIDLDPTNFGGQMGNLLPNTNPMVGTLDALMGAPHTLNVQNYGQPPQELWAQPLPQQDLNTMSSMLSSSPVFNNPLSNAAPMSTFNNTNLTGSPLQPMVVPTFNNTLNAIPTSNLQTSNLQTNTLQTSNLHTLLNSPISPNTLSPSLGLPNFPAAQGGFAGYPTAHSPSGSEFSGGDASRSPILGMDGTPATADSAAKKATDAAHRTQGKRPTLYQCPYPECEKTFTRPYNLKSHYRSHTGERPFKCQYCTHTFPRKHDLKRHEKLHGGGKPFICPACMKSFARADALKRHVKSTDPTRETACAIKIRAMKDAGVAGGMGGSEIEGLENLNLVS
ncbi:hypothetical protein HDU97_001355 [Phlyctochytrium planicorne]|nr:hypothetical protein HDU97_001355 [Phlyctochytrium planicorne]